VILHRYFLKASQPYHIYQLLGCLHSVKFLSHVNHWDTDVLSSYTDVLSSYTDVLSSYTDVLSSYTDVLSPYTDVLSPYTDVLSSYIDVLSSYTDVLSSYTDVLSSTQMFSARQSSSNHSILDKKKRGLK